MLTDGLPAALDWSRAGRELSPKEWHRAVQPDAAGRRPLLLDCRNLYESEAGRFEGAEPVGTDTFSETWDSLRSRPRMHGVGVGMGTCMYGMYALECACMACACACASRHEHAQPHVHSMCTAQPLPSIPASAPRCVAGWTVCLPTRPS